MHMFHLCVRLLSCSCVSSKQIRAVANLDCMVSGSYLICYLPSYLFPYFLNQARAGRRPASLVFRNRFCAGRVCVSAPQGIYVNEAFTNSMDVV